MSAALSGRVSSGVGLFASHYAKLGRALDTAVGAYNQASGSLERRLLVTARTFEQHGIGGDEELEPKPIDKTAIPLTATELTRAESLQGELLPPAADAA